MKRMSAICPAPWSPPPPPTPPQSLHTMQKFSFVSSLHRDGCGCVYVHFPPPVTREHAKMKVPWHPQGSFEGARPTPGRCWFAPTGLSICFLSAGDPCPCWYCVGVVHHSHPVVGPQYHHVPSLWLWSPFHDLWSMHRACVHRVGQCGAGWLSHPEVLQCSVWTRASCGWSWSWSFLHGLLCAAFLCS